MSGQFISHATLAKILDGSDFVLNGTSLSCIITEQNIIDKYFIGLGTIGLLWLLYQIGTYLLFVYQWWSTSNNNLRKRLLPLQIYMRDMDSIIEQFQENGDKFQGDGAEQTAHLRALRTDYEKFIKYDQYCWIKYRNPDKKAFQKGWCGYAGEPTPTHLYEMCRYEQLQARKRTIWPKPDPVDIGLGVATIKKLKNLNVVESDNIQILREVQTGTSRFCCRPVYSKAEPLEISKKNVFFGMYQPYFADVYMQSVNLNEGLQMKRRTVNGLSGSCSRFFCGLLSGWTLETLEIAIKSELDEGHLRADLQLKF